MVGAGLVTEMEKGEREAVDGPSDTLITMLEYLPTFAVVGVPASCPVWVLKFAHAGLPEMENTRVA